MVCFYASFAAVISLPVKAQLRPDETLGTESSVVTSNTGSNGDLLEVIEGGATRGGNLFHSFLDFNISEGEQVYFNSPAGIETILSRVTGNSLSNIDGLLGTMGDSNAALVLMNPNGIVFGEKSRLDVQGAFMSTTATSIQLGDKGVFSAVSPNADNLLSINPSALLFGEQNTTQSEILVKSRRDNGFLPPTGLSVPIGEKISLVGGNVVLEGGIVSAPGGKVAISAIAGKGRAELEESLILELSDSTSRGNLHIDDFAQINVVSKSGGEVLLIAKDITIDSASQVIGGSRDSRLETETGSLVLDATGAVAVSNISFIVNSSNSGRNASGSSGGIIIKANSIDIDKAAFVLTSTADRRVAGDVILTASEDINLQRGGVILSSASQGNGDSGDIVITASNLNLLDSIIGTSASETSSSGDIVISVDELLTIKGTSSPEGELGSRVYTLASKGNGGNIDITATDIEVSVDSQLSTSTSEIGKAGNIRLDISRTASVDSATISSAALNGEGSGGDIELVANNLEIIEGGTIGTLTSSSGDAGNIKLRTLDAVRIEGIDSTSNELQGIVSLTQPGSKGNGGDIELVTNNLEATRGGVVASLTGGDGNAGAVRVQVSDTIRIKGIDSINTVPSGISSTAGPGSTGNGGRVEVKTTRLEIIDGAQINALTAGNGDAGSVDIKVREDALLDGIEGVIPSGITSAVAQTGSGDGGRIKLTAANLEIKNGAFISASTTGSGDAGDISINVYETTRIEGGNPDGFITFRSLVGDGSLEDLFNSFLEIADEDRTDASRLGGASAIVSSVNVPVITGESFPNNVEGGRIELSTNRLEVLNGATIDASAPIRGSAGSIDLNVEEQILIDNGAISTISSDGSGGKITADASSILLRDGDFQTATFFGIGEGGNVEIAADYVIALGDSDILTFAVEGSGGAIDLSQTTLFNQDLSSASASPNTVFDFILLNENGRVDINAQGGLRSGRISINDASVVEKDLADLPEDLVDTEVLIANACVTRMGDTDGTLVLRESDRLHPSPSDLILNTYSTGTIRPISPEEPTAIQEPQALYQLADGRRVMSHRCE